MHISSAHKQRFGKVAKVATAGAMVVSSLGVAVATPASAVALTANSVVLSNSRPLATLVNYTIKFTPSVSTTAIKQVNVEFCTTANSFGVGCTPVPGLAVDNGTIAASSNAVGFSGSGGATTGTFASGSAHTLSYVVTTPAAETNIAHELRVVGSITNPTSAGTYFARVKTYSDTGTTAIDEGTSAFAIVQSVVVSGRVLEQMTFTVAGVTTATQCGSGAAENSTIATTDTTVPFGNYSAGVPIIGCQTVNTATNANTGFTTTLQQFSGGTSPVGAMCRQTATNCNNDGAQVGIAAADAIVDAVLTNTPAAWGSSKGLGIGANGAEAPVAFSAANFYRSFYNAGTAEAITVASKTTPSAGVNTHVVFKSDVTATQTAGVYQSRLMYISTPTF